MMAARDQMFRATPFGRAMPLIFFRSPPSQRKISFTLKCTEFCYQNS